MKPPALGRFLPWILLAVLAVGGGAAFTWLLSGQGSRLRQLNEQLAQRQQESEAFQAQVEKVTQQLGSVSGERTKLEKNAAQLQGKLDTAAADLKRAEDELLKAKDRYDRLSAKQSQIESELTYLKAERDAAKQAAEKARTAQDDLQRTVVRLRSRMALLDRDYKQLASRLEALKVSPRSGLTVLGDSSLGPQEAAPMFESEVSATEAQPQSAYAAEPVAATRDIIELGTVRVSREQDGGRSVVNGQVVEVNLPLNFVILNKGSDDGVHAGMIFNVMREMIPIGQVRAIRVRSGLTACDLITPARVQVGDAALQLSQADAALGVSAVN